jgi:hypothetical protein
VANKILVARGTKARIEEIKSTLTVNELVYSTDTGELGVKKANGNIEYFMNATDINAKVDANANTNAYSIYALALYYRFDKLAIFSNAWESSLAVDPLEISESSSTSIPRGTAQYPNGETEGVIIPHGVTTIGNGAFFGWESNNQPLVIPNSVTSIKIAAFRFWEANTHPLVIPNSVTSIGASAFMNWPLVPYVEIQATTPPTLADANAFSGQNNAPIYVPDESVDAYKTATNWVNLADRIFPVSDMPNVNVLSDRVDTLETSKQDKLVAGDNITIDENTNVISASEETDPFFTAWDKSTGISITKSQVRDLIEATQALSGLMSATDKQRLDVLHALLEEDTENNVVDSINEVLSIFNNYPEGADLVSAFAGKVDKVSGKGLSTNDFTNNDKNKLAGIEAGAEVNPYSKTQLDNMLDEKVDKNANITAGTHPKITYDEKGLVTGGEALAASDIPNLNASKINAGTFDDARIPNLSPTKITQNASNRFVTDVEKAYWDGKQDKLVAGDNITIVGNTISASGGGGDGIDLNMLGYMNYAADIYYRARRQSLFSNAWESSLEVDPSEISVNSSFSSARGKAQYPNGETEGVIIPESVTSIGNNAFRNWQSNNQPLVIPNSVTSIGDYTFYGWSSNNQQLVIPNSVTSIGNSAFSQWNSNDKPLVIPDSVTSIGNSAFASWNSNNQPLVIPNSVTSIEFGAFGGWQANNQPLVIPDSVTSIGNSAFHNWKANNQPLVIPDSVTTIEGYAFQNWTANNQPLVIPNSVTSIGTAAFKNWISNTHPLVIPNSVTGIGMGAFMDWPLVPYVEIQAITPPTLTNINAFDNQNDAPIYVPDESVDDYKTATNWVNLADRIFSINDK